MLREMKSPAPVAVITGASSGIGAATAARFAAGGYRLVLGARREELLASVAERIAARYSTLAIPVPGDVRDPAASRALVDAATQRFDRLDVLVCNAGFGYYGRVEDTTAEDFRDLLETNVLGVHHNLRAALPVMRTQGSGHIVIVGSVVGKQSWAYHGAYSATKAALGALTQALRAELVGSGVSATLVLPATTQSEFFTASKTARGWRPEPIGKYQPVEEVARAIFRSVRRRSPEVNTHPSFRLAATLGEAVPFLPDMARRWYYYRLKRKGEGDADAPPVVGPMWRRP
jgi:short-subunit dehydrogenase